MATIIDALYETGGDLPASINENRRRLGRQLGRARSPDRAKP
jgi:hypothetical protein